MQIVVPTQKEFEHVVGFINRFELDNRFLQHQQFLAGFIKKDLVGFGRIRNHSDCSELCSLGVLEPQRLKGIGKELVKELVKKAVGPLYLVCIIPDYFEALGFKTVRKYPQAMQDKLEYCTQELVVPEPYVVMRYMEP